jgi:hypothetical protein
MQATRSFVKLVGGIPTTDATVAFDYYIKHLNNGRPFILVGHSQGAIVLSNLLSGYMKENPVVYKNMIAAYVIGWPITSEYLAQNPHLKFAEGPDETVATIAQGSGSFMPDSKGIFRTVPQYADARVDIAKGVWI